jgi:hypothetical protein
VAKKFRNLGLSVEYKSSENVDEDLCFMSQSKFFLKGNSGLSKLICSTLSNDAVYFELKYNTSPIKLGLMHAMTHKYGPAAKFYLTRRPR